MSSPSPPSGKSLVSECLASLPSRARVFLNAGGLRAYQFPLRGRLLFGASSIDRLRHFGQFPGRNYAGVDIIGVGVIGVNGDALAVVLDMIASVPNLWLFQTWPPLPRLRRRCWQAYRVF